MKRMGQIVFLGAVIVALALYALTAPTGLPWNKSTSMALAYLGEVVRLPAMPYPFWGFYVQVFGGPVAFSICMAALAAGLLAALVNRYFGWRFAASAALVWIFLPGVWNRAITGEREVCLVAMLVVAVWALNAIGLRILRKARAVKKTNATGASLAGAENETKRGKWNRIAAWSALGAAGLFAIVSLSMHDYQLGEAASVFAKGVVDAAEGRVILLGGVADDQIIREVARRNGCKPQDFKTVSLRNDDAYRTELVEWVKRTWPEDTDLRVAAQVSAATFIERAEQKYAEWFYFTNGRSTTREQWEKRWEAFKPYLASGDPFVRTGRRVFGFEGNAVANAMQEQAKGESETKEAWKFYRRIYEEIDPGNISALVNMNEMIRRGHSVSGEEKKFVQEKLETFFGDPNHRKYVREMVRAAGPVRSDPAMMEKVAEEARKRIAAKVAAGEKIETPPEVLSLIEWSNEMLTLTDKGELDKAGRIARMILSNPKWHGFIPANAVLGAVSAQEGDYVASAAFFQTAVNTTNRVAGAVLNDYADTLMHLDRLDEAEKMARRAVKESDEKFWLPRMTLAEILAAKLAKRERTRVIEDGEKVDRFEKIAGAKEIEAEAKALLKDVLKYAPAELRERIRKMQQTLGR